MFLIRFSHRLSVTIHCGSAAMTPHSTAFRDFVRGGGRGKMRGMTAPIALIDSHLHLNDRQFAADRAAVLDAAAAAGVIAVIEIGYDLPSSRAAVAAAEADPRIAAVVGVQPNHLQELPDDWLTQVQALAARPRVVAVGEIGLDYHWMAASVEQQATAFVRQLELAAELGLPAVIHTRDAMADTIALLARVPQARSIIHSFSGDRAAAAACVALGCYLSFSGPLTYPKSRELQEAARSVPIERLLVETDSPYLSPQARRGRRNEPANVAYVAAFLAELRGMSPAELAPVLIANTLRAFPRLNEVMHANEPIAGSPAPAAV
jgi:TatD DNase family protein